MWSKVCRIRPTESGYDVEIIVKDPQMDAANQVTAAEELVTAGSQLEIVCSVDLAAMPPIVDYIKNEKGLPLIAHQSPFEGADCYVSIEDYSFGKTGGNAVGKYIADQMGGQAKIAILHGKTVGENLVQRYQGYVDGIREFAPDVEIVAEAAGYEEEMAMEALSTILTEHPDIDIVIGTNDPRTAGRLRSRGSGRPDRADQSLRHRQRAADSGIRPRRARSCTPWATAPTKPAAC